jgi:hypothetical protein
MDPDHLTGCIQPKRPDAEAAYHPCSPHHTWRIRADPEACASLQLPGEEALGHPAVYRKTGTELDLLKDAGVPLGRKPVFRTPNPGVAK